MVNQKNQKIIIIIDCNSNNYDLFYQIFIAFNDDINFINFLMFCRII